MARRRRAKTHLVVSLFPFLSVLACVIGTLTLLLAAIAIGRLGGPSLEWVAMVEEMDRVREIILAGEAQLEQLEAQLRSQRIKAEENEALGLRLTALGLAPEVSFEELTGLINQVEEAVRLKAEVRRLRTLRAGLSTQIEQGEKAYEKRKKTREAAPIIIEPSGVGREWQPFLVECGSDYVEYYDAGDGQSRRIPAEDIQQGHMLPRVFRYIRAIPGSLVIFLIRPAGVETCQKARALATRYNVRLAELPLPGSGPLDLSRMSKASRF